MHHVPFIVTTFHHSEFQALSTTWWDFLTHLLFFLQHQVDDLTDTVAHFEEISHPDSGDMRARQEFLVSRFEALKEPLATRKKKLIDLLRLQQICRDSEDEEAWIQETEPSAASTQLGQCNWAGRAIRRPQSADKSLRNLARAMKGVESLLSALSLYTHENSSSPPYILYGFNHANKFTF